MTRTRCSACGSKDLRIILDLGDSPIADAYVDTADATSDRYALRLGVCDQCSLVQLMDPVDHSLLFNDDYTFYTSGSPALLAYNTAYAHDIKTRWPKNVKRTVVEIGCNDGSFLRHFVDDAMITLGVDPSAGPARVARGRGLEVVIEPFTHEVAHAITKNRGHASLVFANHVLAHVADVSDTMAGIAELLEPTGVAIIEVQYLPDLLQLNAFDMVYHEHRHFFTLNSVEAAAAVHNLHVIDAELTERQGGALRATLAYSGTATDAVERIKQSERWLLTRDAYGGVQGRAEWLRYRLRELIRNEIAAGRNIIGCGAPAKATTLLNFCGIDSTWMPSTFDLTPEKYGTYIPGTGILVMPEYDVKLTGDDTVLLLTWNYASEIMRTFSKSTAAGCRWILPVPGPVIL